MLLVIRVEVAVTLTVPPLVTTRVDGAAEAQLVWARSLELTERPIGGRYDLTHLRALHRHLFQDVYPFAGDLRTVDLRKADDPGGWFHRPHG